MEDYEIDDETSCPKCGGEIHYRDCDNIACDDGYIDESFDDPINFLEGELEYRCPDCHGTGIISWCSKCGAELIAHGEHYIAIRYKT